MTQKFEIIVMKESQCNKGWEELDYALVEFKDFKSIEEFIQTNWILNYEPSADPNLDVMGTFYVGTGLLDYVDDSYA